MSFYISEYTIDNFAEKKKPSYTHTHKFMNTTEKETKNINMRCSIILKVDSTVL